MLCASHAHTQKHDQPANSGSGRKKKQCSRIEGPSVCLKNGKGRRIYMITFHNTVLTIEAQGDLRLELCELLKVTE